jgi:hypothetical protein
MTHQLKNLQNG